MEDLLRAEVTATTVAADLLRVEVTTVTVVEAVVATAVADLLQVEVVATVAEVAEGLHQVVVEAEDAAVEDADKTT